MVANASSPNVVVLLSLTSESAPTPLGVGVILRSLISEATPTSPGVGTAGASWTPRI
ncbi:hypothetical protein PR003_g15603 [Phytophthora rubi]|uniref:Uncharacterized protein n=1 Tax=Phytophthora rubi TaxID=129364 RepID=A0A6A4ENI6_9STRA|nr:hypothetical protein PR003_g15603 [Phytophthora rubi]